MFSNLINDVKAFFLRSWSIFLARLEVLTGIAIGIFSAIDWSSLASLDWTNGIANKGSLIAAILFIIKGVVSELGRRQNTVVSEQDQLVPSNLAGAVKVKK